MTTLKTALAAAALVLGAGTGAAFAGPSEPTVFGHRVAPAAQTEGAAAIRLQEGRASAKRRLFGPASAPTVFGHPVAPAKPTQPFKTRLDR